MEESRIDYVVVCDSTISKSEFLNYIVKFIQYLESRGLKVEIKRGNVSVVETQSVLGSNLLFVVDQGKHLPGHKSTSSSHSTLRARLPHQHTQSRTHCHSGLHYKSIQFQMFSNCVVTQQRYFYETGVRPFNATNRLNCWLTERLPIWKGFKSRTRF